MKKQLIELEGDDPDPDPVTGEPSEKFQDILGAFRARKAAEEEEAAEEKEKERKAEERKAEERKAKSTAKKSGTEASSLVGIEKKIRDELDRGGVDRMKITTIIDIIKTVFEEDAGLKMTESQIKFARKKVQQFLLERGGQKSMFTISNESGKNLSSIEEHLDDFLNYSHSKLDFANPVSVKFISDSDNAQDTLGKTAFYDPAMNEISLYVDNRHPKDVMRSLSHELVHHAQNCRGDFSGQSPIGEQGYAQKDSHLREMEREAYETGNMVFRDFCDGVIQQASLEEWRRDRLTEKLMERMGLKVPEEDIDSFRCIVETKQSGKNIAKQELKEMKMKDAYALIMQEPEEDRARLLALTLQDVVAALQGVDRPELATVEPGMTDAGRALAARAHDWYRKPKPSASLPEDLGDIEVEIPSSEEVEAVASGAGLEPEPEPEEEPEEELTVKEWYYSKLNKKLMEGIK